MLQMTSQYSLFYLTLKNNKYDATYKFYYLCDKHSEQHVYCAGRIVHGSNGRGSIAID